MKEKTKGHSEHRHDHHGHGGGKYHKKNHWLHEIKGGRGPRIERGEIRYILLDALKNAERHGYEIMRAVEEKSGGIYKPSPGSVYPALQMMEDLEWIEPIEGEKKKKFRITESGLQELEDKSLLIKDIYADMNRVSSPELDKFLEDAHLQFKVSMKGIYRAYQAGKLNIEDSQVRESLEKPLKEMVQKVNDFLEREGQK